MQRFTISLDDDLAAVRRGVRHARAAAVLFLACFAVAARAHTENAVAGGLAAGFLHPLTGIDHLLAMVAVGLWGATLGRPLVWALPIAFPLLMVVGGVAGIARLHVPWVETGIALSVVVLGLAILSAWRAPVAAAVAVVAAFGMLHGYAHGLELPGSAAPSAYAAGFVVSTGLLHLAGIAAGTMVALPRGRLLLRACGGLIAAAGLWILAGIPGA